MAIYESLSTAGIRIKESHLSENSQAEIRNVTTMDVSFSVPFGLDSNTKGSTGFIKERLETISKALLDMTNHKTHSSSFISYKNKFPSWARIVGMTEMDLNYNLIQFPVYKINSYITKDAFVRQSRPRSNYGYYENMSLGQSLDGEYVVLLQADVSQILDLDLERESLEIRKAHLFLYFPMFDSYLEKPEVEVYEIDRDWQENSVTWAESLAFNLTYVFNFNIVSQVNRVNILDYLKDLKSRGKTVVNILLKTKVNKTFSISAKETEDLIISPKIEFEFRDFLEPIFYGSKNKVGTSVIRRKDKLDLEYCTSRIISEYQRDSEDISGTALLKELRGDSDLSSQISLSNYDGSTVVSMAGIRLSNKICTVNIVVSSRIPSGAIITSKTNYNMNSFAGIRGSNKISTAKLKSSNSIHGAAFIREREKDEIISGIKIVGQLNQKISTAKFRYFSGMISDARIRVKTNSDETSNLVVRRSSKQDTLSMAKIIYIENMNSEAVIRAIKNYDFNGKGFIYAEVLNSINSNAIIRRKDFKDITSSSSLKVISNKESNGFIRISETKNEKSSAIIRREEQKDIISESILKQILETNSTAEIRGFNYHNEFSSAEIRIEERKDLISETTLKIFLDGNSTAKLVYPADEDYFGNSIIRRKDSSEEECIATISVQKFSDRAGKVKITIINQFNSNDIPAQAFIRVDTFNSDIISGMKIRQEDLLDTVSNVIIRSQESREIKGSVIIMAKRHWIPNRQGYDIFSFEDRKLPRQYKYK